MESRTILLSRLSGLSERRKCVRYPLETNGVSFDSSTGENRGVVLNLCDDGMAVYADAQVELGSIKNLRWELPQQVEPLGAQGVVIRADKESGRFKVEYTERFKTEGTVVWVDQENKSFGIKFQNLPESVKQSICRWTKYQGFPTSSAPSQLVEHTHEASQANPGRDTALRHRRMADSAPIVQIPHFTEIIPPRYTGPLPDTTEARRSKRSWLPIVAIIALICFVLLGVGAYWGYRAESASALGSPIRMLRLAGSNSIGVKLAPTLAQAFLKQLGARDIRIVTGAKGDEESVRGVLHGDPVEVQVALRGTTAFECLMNSSCDIGISSRKIRPKEISELSSLGNLSSPASEHILGLDGIAVIVNSSNPVQTLTLDQLAKIFSGTVVDWSQVSSQHGAINVYARDDKSGIYDTFKTLVLGNKQLVRTARRLEDSQSLSDAVAGDRNGIGFTALPFILSAKSIAIAERGTIPFQPNRLTIGTEDYPLSHRLYLYTPASPQNSYVRRFVEFALSKAGQEVVGDSGFIAQNVTSENGVISPNAPYAYRRLTQGAGRLSLDFRFLPGLTTLDSRGLADLDRVVSFVADSGYSGENVLLFGFTDNTGDRNSNIGISQIRAKIVAEEFARRGLKPATVKGFGPAMPVSSNDTDAGRERNRRVEIWLKQLQCAAPLATR
jgi:phosphate transport system substrate-binding protein